MMADWRWRFWQKIEIKGPDDCWEWIGGRSTEEYGYFWIKPRIYPAHRIMYEIFIGPIPNKLGTNATLDIDHLCRNHWCVNPSHLQAVTQEVNLARGTGIGGRRLARCKSGLHELTEENRRWTTKGDVCRSCAINRSAAYNEKLRQEKLSLGRKP